MKAAKTLENNPYRDDTALGAVLAALGGASQAKLVGGAVRGALLGEGVADIDIATTHTPAQATALLEQAGIKVVPTGIDHGTVTAVVDGRGFEITTLRRDVETDGRRAVVAFTQDWLEDAKRRDFTMNTLLMDMDGAVYDPTGQGISDLENGIVRFVGEAAVRIAEDGLRILRFFRFHARYGRGAPDASGYDACVHNRHLIANLSRERVTQEIEKLVMAWGAGEAIQAMVSGEILGEVWQENFNEDDHVLVQELVEQTSIAQPETLVFAYSVYQENPVALEEILNKYFVFSNKKKAFLISCIKVVQEPFDSVLQGLYLHGMDVVLGAIILSSVINEEIEDIAMIEGTLELVQEMTVPVLPIGAKDLIADLGFSEGPQLGVALKKVEAWWLQKNTAPDRNACLDYAKRLAPAS